MLRFKKGMNHTQVPSRLGAGFHTTIYPNLLCPAPEFTCFPSDHPAWASRGDIFNGNSDLCWEQSSLSRVLREFFAAYILFWRWEHANQGPHWGGVSCSCPREGPAVSALTDRVGRLSQGSKSGFLGHPQCPLRPTVPY